MLCGCMDTFPRKEGRMQMFGKYCQTLGFLLRTTLASKGGHRKIDRNWVWLIHFNRKMQSTTFDLTNLHYHRHLKKRFFKMVFSVLILSMWNEWKCYRRLTPAQSDTSPSLPTAKTCWRPRRTSRSSCGPPPGTGRKLQLHFLLYFYEFSCAGDVTLQVKVKAV